MSEPKRYHLYAGLEVHAYAKAEAVLKFRVEDDGMWVIWEDYARLKAEVDKLTFRPEHYLDDDGEWVSNIVFYRMQERLKAEVERLKEDKQQLEARLDFLENPRS